MLPAFILLVLGAFQPAHEIPVILSRQLGAIPSFRHRCWVVPQVVSYVVVEIG